jgi:type I restriction enzyme R subunit
MQSAGTVTTKILPPVSRFAAGEAHAVKKRTVLEKLAAFLERFLGLSSLGDEDGGISKHELWGAGAVFRC